MGYGGDRKYVILKHPFGGTVCGQDFWKILYWYGNSVAPY